MLAVAASTAFAAKKITIHTMPENATIQIDGAEVGNGTYTVKFERKVDFYLVKVSAPGYLTKSFKLLKSNPNNSVLYRLSPDEAMQSSRGGEDAGMDMANRWFDIICGKGVSDDEIWKRLIGVSLNYFRQHRNTRQGGRMDKDRLENHYLYRASGAHSNGSKSRLQQRRGHFVPCENNFRNSRQKLPGSTVLY